MTIYKYYVVIEPEEDVFTVSFPDLENCFTDGATLEEAVEMAHDALGALLAVYEDDGDAIPTATDAEKIVVPGGAELILITVDTDNFK
ncbi:antitoxin HicB [Bacillus sp. FJAT-25509]|uniref:type II toxin-antitoxin system HicB family antitoxin n=1 Tax=Bacillus sp. FJAT-25509 TaxID=1712029 RepID=UPI0006F9C994|nr:type II toxin-antitoxin system HicB family antitoxin [Bacillus sp. FJAT-25509]KQL36250.1 antitoxin HicB [Bacillus sp. FJAT-25509]